MLFHSGKPRKDKSQDARTNNAHVNEEVLKQVPHAWSCVDLLDFNLRINVAMTQEVHVHRLHLMDKSHNHRTSINVNANQKMFKVAKIA